MQKYNSFVEIRDLKGPGLGLIQLVLFCFGGLAVFQAISVIPLMVFFNLDFREAAVLPEVLSDPRSKSALYVMKAAGSVGGYILGPLFYIRFYQSAKIGSYFFFGYRYWQPVVYVVLITLCFIIVNSLFIEWNLQINFPKFMEGFETWAQAKEEKLKVITLYLTDFNGFKQLLVVLPLIAIIPGIGEELLFRGLIQTRLQQITSNPHVAIWASAFFFSAYHMQFYGFLPRMLLGAFFGYIFLWSGNLVLAMIAHVFNNSFSLVMFHLHKSEIIENTGSLPLWITGVFFSIGTFLAYFFIKLHKVQHTN